MIPERGRGVGPLTRQVVLRADASESVGTGHVVRCRTLADALIARGWRATLVTRDLPDGLLAGSAEAGLSIARLPAASSIESEPTEIARRIQGDIALVVGDHYGLTAGWFRAMRGHAPRAIVMAIDDLADRSLDVDIVLDQNLGADAAAYAPLVPAATRVLAGPSYALLRPEFATLRAAGRDRDGRIERILVFISGADRTDVTARAVEGLGPLGIPMDVVVGVAYPHLAGLRSLVTGQPDTALHVNTDAMATLMHRADLAVGAPSSASWERCALGLPAVLVTLADNQVVAQQRLVEAGAATAIGRESTVTPADIGRAVRSLCADPGRVAGMARAAANVTDGHGTDRVVAEIEAIGAGRWEAT